MANRVKEQTFELDTLPQKADFISELTLGSFSDIKHLVKGSHSQISLASYSGIHVVVKVVLEEFAHNHTALHEFTQEIRILSRLTHPNIINIIGSGEKEGRCLIAIEYLEGLTLHKVLNHSTEANTQTFSTSSFLKTAHQFADAVDYLHNHFDTSCTLIHRDLKPDNIGFTADGVLKLFDFGLCVAVKKSAAVNGSYILSG